MAENPKGVVTFRRTKCRRGDSIREYGGGSQSDWRLDRDDVQAGSRGCRAPATENTAETGKKNHRETGQDRPRGRPGSNQNTVGEVLELPILVV